jgi:hypothetical protein
MWLMLWLAVALAFPLEQSSGSAAQAEQPSSSKVWIGRYTEYEEFLRSATIERMQDIGVGVTAPRHAFFTPGGLAGGGVVKNLPPGMRNNYWESYQSEIAAYRLDRLLQLEMVPPTIERKVERDFMSIQLWVDDTRTLKEVQQKNLRAPDVDAWNRQLHRAQVFDNLIGNIDENSGNLLFDRQWNFIKVDHSRCFTEVLTLPFPNVKQIDRPFFERLKALDQQKVRQEIGNLVKTGAVGALFRRRDAIVKGFEALAKKEGDAAVFVAWPDR